jgi:pimeloyl-ACP methyl ester carboxylesterase
MTARPTPSAEPFEIAVPESDLADLHERLARTRLPDDFANDDWGYGFRREYLEELVAYWRDEYDWRAAETAMNAYAHHRVVLDDIPVHYLVAPGRGPAALPIVLSHGWPWTFWDFHKVIGPLADPGAHGGDPADAFDVVVPSLPGYGFSSPLRTPGVTPAVIAGLWTRLMRDVLGYDRFAAQGGDWGASITAWLGHAHAEHLVGVHCSLPAFITLDPRTIGPDAFGPGEEDWYERSRRRRKFIDSHVLVHRRDAQTIAAALNDSPAGLAAWIVERRRHWSDCDGDVERRFTKDDLLTTVSIYWFTQTFHTSARLYAEMFRSATMMPVHDRRPEVEAPTGIAVFPHDVFLVPRAVAEARTDLRRWTVMPRGGHFAPMEEPELLVDDVRAFFRPLR